MPNAHPTTLACQAQGAACAVPLQRGGVEQTGSLRAIQGARRPAGEGPRIRTARSLRNL